MEQKSIDSRYMTVKQIAEDPSFCFTVPMLRYYILHAHSNGLTPVLRRIGRKILIRRDLFINWLEKQSNKGVRLGQREVGNSAKTTRLKAKAFAACMVLGVARKHGKA